MEKFLVLSLMLLIGIFIAFLAVMILTRMVYDIVMGFIRVYQWATGRKRST